LKAARVHIKKFLSYADTLPPRSAKAFIFAVVFVVLAAGVREFFSSFGATLLFSSFYPAVLIIALFAGPWAGIFGAVLAALVSWWAFVVPSFEFTRLGATEYANFSLFLLSTLLIVWLAHLYRQQVVNFRKSEMERELLLKEMHHRIRNSFAVVQSIVRASLADLPELADKITGRVQALSRTNDMIDHSNKYVASLRTLILNELEPYPTAGRINLVGPDLQLPSDVARNLSLVFHEMTTNAFKHGSLKDPNGRLEVSWLSDGDHCILAWQERDGPAITDAEKLGFGTRMMTRALDAIGGSAVHEFSPTGLYSRVSFPLQ
jgi:two-component sensor histidine kinase